MSSLLGWRQTSELRWCSDPPRKLTSKKLVPELRCLLLLLLSHKHTDAPMKSTRTCLTTLKSARLFLFSSTSRITRLSGPHCSTVRDRSSIKGIVVVVVGDLAMSGSKLPLSKKRLIGTVRFSSVPVTTVCPESYELAQLSVSVATKGSAASKARHAQ